MERRYALLEEVYIQMVELRGCLDPEGETEAGVNAPAFLICAEV